MRFNVVFSSQSKDHSVTTLCQSRRIKFPLHSIYATNCISLALKNTNAFALVFFNAREMHAETRNKQPIGCERDTKLSWQHIYICLIIFYDDL